MNIVFITTYDSSCGIATYTKKLAKELAKEHKVFILAELDQKAFAPTHYNDPDTGAYIYKLWKRSNPYKAAFGLSSIINFFRAQKNFKPDAIHIQHEFGIFPYDEAFFTLLQELGEFTSNKVITFHTISRPPDNVGFFSKLENYIVKTIAHTGPGLTVLSKTPSEFGTLSTFTLIPHGCPSPVTLPRGIKSLPDGVNILCSGFMAPSKGHEELITSFGLAWPEFINPAYLHIVGLCRDNNYLNTLKSQIRSFNLESNILIDEGFKTDTEIEEYQNSVDFVLLGGRKTSPYSASGQLAQALGAQLPVIAKDLPIYRSQNSEKVMYFIDNIECAYFIKQLVNSKTLRLKLGNHEGFPTWPDVARKHISLYNT